MDELLGTWSVDELDGRPALSSAQAEITFLDDGTLNGSTGVNRFRADYVVADETLTVGLVITTRMAGPPEAMAQERLLLDVLSRPLNVEVTDDQLILDDGDRKSRLRRTTPTELV